MERTGYETQSDNCDRITLTLEQYDLLIEKSALVEELLERQKELEMQVWSLTGGGCI